MPQATLSLIGILVGGKTIECDLDSTVSVLKMSINNLRGVRPDEPLKLLCKGKLLSEADRTLASYSVTGGAKIAVLSDAVDPKLAQQEKAASLEDSKQEALQSLITAMQAICNRQAEDGLHQRQYTLEDQAGLDVALPPAERKALTLGIAFHGHGQKLLQNAAYKDALAVLELSEKAFEMVDLRKVGAIDNVALMLIDLVWCCYKLQDDSQLTASSRRLARARDDLARAHGPNMQRIRKLQGSFVPETATYVRLELLEGINNYYNSRAIEAMQHLQQAQQLLAKLQVSEAALIAVMGMGFSLQTATRALRFCGDDLQKAVEFCVAQRAKGEMQAEKQNRNARLIKKQKKVGRTPSGKYLNMDTLEQMESLGFPSKLAAAALKLSENSLDEALNALSNEMQREDLELSVIAQTCEAKSQAQAKRRRKDLASTHAGDNSADPIATTSIEGCALNDSDSESDEEHVEAAPEDPDAVAERARQAALEEEVVNGLQQSGAVDHLAAYDVDVSDESSALNTFLQLVSQQLSVDDQ